MFLNHFLLLPHPKEPFVDFAPDNIPDVILIPNVL